jgi:hypothetical protein
LYWGFDCGVDYVVDIALGVVRLVGWRGVSVRAMGVVLQYTREQIDRASSTRRLGWFGILK